MWLKKLQIAVIEKNTDNLAKLLEETPKFENKEDAKKAMYMLREAMELVYTLKDETSAIMKQLKKSIDFLKVTQPQLKNRLDIKS